MRITVAALMFSASSLLLLPALPARADEPAKKEAEASPLFCVKGKQLVSEDFTSPALAKDWKVAKGKWEVKDGAVRGNELADEKHAAVLRRDLPVHDLIAEFSFRFDGGKGLSFGLNNKGGHVCRAKITPATLQVTRDRPNEKSAEKAAVLDTQFLDIKPGEWHTAVVEIGGKTIVAAIDGKIVAFGSHDALDTEKTVFSFPVVGDGVSLKAIRIWDATPPADPAAALKKLESLHAKTASAEKK
jgi:hypothetical protein